VTKIDRWGLPIVIQIHKIICTRYQTVAHGSRLLHTVPDCDCCTRYQTVAHGTRLLLVKLHWASLQSCIYIIVLTMAATFSREEKRL